MTNSVHVVLPCLNEAAALPWVLSRLPAGFHPIVVDNGSTDGSDAVAADFGAVTVRVPQRGFGAACHAGIQAATCDVVCVMDADASLDPAELPHVAAPVLGDEADLVLGRRVATGRGAWPPHARAANAVLAAIVRRRTAALAAGAGPASRADLRDLGPMRALRRDAALRLDLTDRRFGYPLEMVVRAAAAGWRIHEVGVRYYPRRGRSKVTGTVRGTVRAVRDMRRVLAS